MTQTWIQPELPLSWPGGTPPMSAARRLSELKEANQKAYAELTTPDVSGTRAIPDPMGVLSLRLQLLIDAVLSDTLARTEYEIAFEEQMAATLEACQGERRKLLLTAPGVPTNLIVPR